MLDFLNKAFAGLDYSVIKSMEAIMKSAGGFFTPICKVVTFLGEYGILYLLIAFVLLLFSKTRKIGVCIIGGIAFSAIFTSFIIKPLVARPRPFLDERYHLIWAQYIGGKPETGYSFPSGHVTSITATVLAYFFFGSKKWGAISFSAVILMAFARVYLLAHYASDVLFGIIIGTLAFCCSAGVTVLIFKLLNKFSNIELCAFILDFNVFDFLKKAIDESVPPVDYSDEAIILEQQELLKDEEIKFEKKEDSGIAGINTEE